MYGYIDPGIMNQHVARAREQHMRTQRRVRLVRQAQRERTAPSGDRPVRRWWGRPAFRVRAAAG